MPPLRRYYSNLVQQFEAAGAPHSWGDKLGEGTRLILGTDVMGFTTAEVRDSTGGSPTATRFLMPASAAAFDPRCNGTNDPSAVKPGCAAVGTHASMKARATRTAPWSGPAAEARIYGGLNWTFNTDWEAVRATLNGSVPAPGDNPDWRSRDMPSRMDAGVPEGVTPVPFSGISDRVWWSPEKYNYWVASEQCVGTRGARACLQAQARCRRGPEARSVRARGVLPRGAGAPLPRPSRGVRQSRLHAKARGLLQDSPPFTACRPRSLGKQPAPFTP